MYDIEVRRLYEVLMRQGWTRRDIEKVRPKPSYKDRESIIAEFMIEQERRKAEWMAEHTDEELWNTQSFSLMKYPKTDKEKVVCVGPRYNGVFDDGHKLKTLVENARQDYLPESLRTRDMLLVMRGAQKAEKSFKRHCI